MTINQLCYVAAAGLTACLLIPTSGTAARHYNLSINGDNPERCSDLKVKSSNGEASMAEQSFSFAKGEAPVLELSGADHGIIRVKGWDRPEYSIQACKIAAAETMAAAEQIARSITVGRSGGRFFTNTPAANDSDWEVYYIVRAPKDANLDLDTKNGPIEVSDITGSTKVRAINGPVAVKGMAGVVDVHTENGPVAFEGNAGEVHLIAQNGPISVKLQGETWNGPTLEARTANGPLSLEVPDTFRTGIRVDTSGHAPFSCALGACKNAMTDATGDGRILRLNGSSETIRVSTQNGPVSVSTPKTRGHVI
jgi:hypothetical protein